MPILLGGNPLRQVARIQIIQTLPYLGHQGLAFACGHAHWHLPRPNKPCICDHIFQAMVHNMHVCNIQARGLARNIHIHQLHCQHKKIYTTYATHGWNMMGCNVLTRATC